MATWDSADLLARCQRESGVPAVAAYPLAADWYAWLTQAQHEWIREIASHVPEALYGPPTLLTTADGGETYRFPTYYVGDTGTKYVFAVELYDKKDGALLRPGPYWDSGSDYVFEGDRIRFPLGRKKTFANGPFARYVAEPPDISASSEPVLRPPSARVLLVYRAVELYMSRGNYGDPTPWIQKQNEAYYGGEGGTGILASLKAGDTFGGVAAFGAGDAPWYRGIDVGGYTP